MTADSTGFSDPDPANVDEDEQPLPERFPSIPDDPQELESEMVMVNADASCLKCSHFEVCAVYSGVRPMLEDWHTEDDPEAEAPIDVERLAWICEAYAPEEP